MKYTNYMQNLSNATTVEEVSQIKETFLAECKKREQKILVSNILGKVDNFCTAQNMFESMIVPLMKEKGGKQLINKYVKVIKENTSLKTLYAYSEGLKDNNTSDTKKAYITEALSLSNPIKYNEYVKGVGNIVNLIAEAFAILGDEYVLENVSYDENRATIGNSLLYLATTKKNIKNLNEYISHMDVVSEIITENNTNSVDIDLTLGEIVSEMTQKMISNVENIFSTDNKEKTFCECKEMCLNLISQQIQKNSDKEVLDKLHEMENKLTNKHYVFETFTKDMLYMTELQDVLK